MSRASFIKYLILSGSGAVITIASNIFSIQMLAVVQAETPEHLIGKVIACIMTLIMCAQPFGQLIYGLLFERIGVFVIILCTGVVSMCISQYAKGVLRELGGPP